MVNVNHKNCIKFSKIVKHGISIGVIHDKLVKFGVDWKYFKKLVKNVEIGYITQE